MSTYPPVNPKIKPDDILGREVRHVSYTKAVDGMSDLLVAKEYLHLKDGSRVPNLHMVKDFQRKFWVSRPGRRQEHKDKLQWDSLNNLLEYTTAEHEMSAKIHRALGSYGRDRGMYQNSQSPYLYGSGIKAQCLLKDDYMTKYEKFISPRSTMAVLDIETDVLHGTGEPILVTVTFKDKVFTGIKRSYLKATAEHDEHNETLIMKRLNDLLSEQVEKRGLKFELFFADEASDICAEAIKRAHAWEPDFVAIWNLDFDIPKMVKAMERGGCHLPDVFSDPRVPYQYRSFNYNAGPTVKTTHTGRTTPVPIEKRWPVVDAPSSFYWIDAMCLYARLRIAGGREESYALDAVMNKHINMGKLKFTETDHLSKLDWHIEMQKNYKFEYIAYNIFDCIGMELLDEKTGDIGYAFSALCDRSDFSDFKSDPTQISDAMHFHCLKHGHVFGTNGGDIRDENDTFVVKPKGWIVTLDAFLAQHIGLDLIEGLPNHQTQISIHCADLDIEGTYPTEQEATNACKETTIREIVKIEGITEIEMREIGVNLSAGETNACSIATTVYKVPDKIDLLEMFLLESAL